MIRKAESELGAWFDANSKTSDETQPVHQIKNIQVLSLDICLVEESWTDKAYYSGYGWVWKDGSGNEQLLA